jgi:hemoglobin
MTQTVRWIRRTSTRVAAAVLPFALAGCAVLFPPRHGAAPAAAPAAPAAAQSTPSAPAEKTASQPGSRVPSLYVRLGGQPGIVAFSDDFLGRVTNDPVIMPFFKGLTDADLQRIRQHVIELLCAATGGGCTYSGKDMKTVHAQMEINNDIWNQFTGHLNESVTRFHIPDRERNELVVIIASLKPQIVTK